LRDQFNIKAIKACINVNYSKDFGDAAIQIITQILNGANNRVI